MTRFRQRTLLIVLAIGPAVLGLRRMRVRYDRLAVIQDAWSTLAAAVICFQITR